MRLAASLLVALMVGYVALKIVFGVAGGIVGILISLAWLALKVMLVVGLIYWLMTVFSPETARKMKDSFRGQSM